MEKKISLILLAIIATSMLLGIGVASVLQPPTVNTNTNTQIVHIGDGNKYITDLNTAPLEELTDLEGVGKNKAEDIISSRKEKPFSSKYDLLSRKLIGEDVMENIKDRVEVK